VNAARLVSPVRRRLAAVRAAARDVRRRGDVREARAAIEASGARVALVLHRVAPRDLPKYEIVPTLPPSLFRRQLEALGELGRFVPLDDLTRATASADARPRFALTFDDDLGTHAHEALSVLKDLGLSATFFLSGRSLHGLGGYWFERLEALIAERGLERSAAALGVPAATDMELAHRCEAHERALGWIERHAPAVGCSLDAAGIRALVENGMAIGFHTLHHRVLPTLDDATLREAVVLGRDELASLVGMPLTSFAYPHGKANRRVVEQVRREGFTEAWTTSPSVFGSDDDAFLRGRWDPLPVSVDHMVIRLGNVVRARGGGR
jgi:peptidoglycan/xylan/chitin deacetylase (PgdA/CDA1 family)